MHTLPIVRCVTELFVVQFLLQAPHCPNLNGADRSRHVQDSHRPALRDRAAFLINISSKGLWAEQIAVHSTGEVVCKKRRAFRAVRVVSPPALVSTFGEPPEALQLLARSNRGLIQSSRPSDILDVV